MENSRENSQENSKQFNRNEKVLLEGDENGINSNGKGNNNSNLKKNNSKKNNTNITDIKNKTLNTFKRFGNNMNVKKITNVFINQPIKGDSDYCRVK